MLASATFIHWTEPATAAVLPKSYYILGSRTLASLLKTMASISVTNRNLPKHSATTTGGQERVTDTARLARLNLAVHGLSGDIKQGNTYYEDLQDSGGRFDFVLANPPFNVSKIDKERLAGDPRYPFRIPRTDNGNYLWIQHFHSALNKNGRAGFVMANSAADARASEQEIRELEAKITENVTELLEA